MATHASASTIAYVGRMAQIDQDAFAADCFWECWLMTWARVGQDASWDMLWQRARSTTQKLEAARAVVAPERPSLAEIKRQLAETVGCQARRANSLRIADQEAFDKLMVAIANNCAQVVVAMFDAALGEEG